MFVSMTRAVVELHLFHVHKMFGGLIFRSLMRKVGFLILRGRGFWIIFQVRIRKTSSTGHEFIFTMISVT